MSDPGLLVGTLSPSQLAGLFGLAGLLVGSFLNVCIYRLPRRESLLWPGSHCPACDRTLSWFENVPVVSWLVLRGRCRGCRAPIPLQYPLVELANSALWGLAALLTGLEWLLVVRLLFVSALVVLFVIDLRHRILPDAITLTGIGIGLLASIWLSPGLLASGLGALLGGGCLWALSETYFRLRGHEGLGFGDVKMLAMIGAVLGWKLMLLTLFLASLSGSVLGVSLMALGRGGLQSALPFGTFLAVGGVVAAFGGDAMLAWYLGLYP